MSFDHKKAYAKLMKQHEMERKFLSATDISDEKIEVLFEFDIRQLNRDRSFYSHLDAFTVPNDEVFNDSSEPESSLHWLEQIENPLLLKALKALSPQELEIVDLHLNQQLPLTYIAKYLDKPYWSVAKKYERAARKIKKYFL